MNLLTFDIEEWYLEKVLHGARQEKYKLFDEMLEKVLTLLSECGIHATFFCLGQMAIHFPNVIRKIAEAGHEIGCHSHVHSRLNQMSPSECRNDTRVAIDSLEQCIGKKIRIYRAPAFSITSNTPWAFEVLSENGIEIDASIFPVSRDFGGFLGFGCDRPCLVNLNGRSIKEFPICPTHFIKWPVVFSGGGYFRVFPQCYIESRIKKNDYTMMYFHLSDLAALKFKFMSRKEYELCYRESAGFFQRFKRYIKDNLSWGNTLDKFSSIIRSNCFIDIGEADTKIDWNKSIVISL